MNNLKKKKKKNLILNSLLR